MSGNDPARKVLVLDGLRIPFAGSSSFVEHTVPARYTKTVGGSGRPCFNRIQDQSVDITINTLAHEAAHGLLGAVYAKQEANVALGLGLLMIPYKYIDMDTGDMIEAGGVVIMQPPMVSATNESPERSWGLCTYASADVHGTRVSVGPI